MRAGALVAAAALVVAAPPWDAAAAAVTTRGGWVALARSMTAPWPSLQNPDGSFHDYVVAAHPGGPPRDPYGRSFVGLALLQAGIRDSDDHQIPVALEALAAAAARPVHGDRIVFENLALATAYNVARAHLAGTRVFEAVRPILERRLRNIRVVQFNGKRPYYNYWLVHAASLVELLSSGLTSNVTGSALAQRSRTRALVLDLVNGTIPRVARRYTTADRAGPLAFISDPPWNPPAYDAFSLALLVRIVNRLGSSAGRAARDVIRGSARSLWALASPAGSVSYYGRSQDQSWTLAMTAFGAESAARLPGTKAEDAARFDALAERALTRLREVYSGGAFGFWITPAMREGVKAAIPGLDRYADAASYSGLTLAGLNWAIEVMPATGPAAGQLAADTVGTHRLASGPSAIQVVRTPNLFYAVKQGPGTFVRGAGDYSTDVRYDSGLVALEEITAGKAVDLIPLRPHSNRPGDRAEPLLLGRGGRTRFWGTRTRPLAGGGVALTGSFRRGRRVVRSNVAILYEPSACGLRMSLPTRRGDRMEQSLWFRGRVRLDSTGSVLTDGVQQVTLAKRPGRVVGDGVFASGTESRLRRVRLRFAATGAPLTFDFCARGA